MAQYAALWGSPELAAPCQSLIDDGTVSSSQMRSLWGAGTHQAAVWAVLDLADTLTGGFLSSRRDTGVPECVSQPCHSVATACGGLNLCGLQTLAWWRARYGSSMRPARLAWVAEACPIARRAGMALARALGQTPAYPWRAESAALHTTAWSATVEWDTPRCSPYSTANAYFPVGVDAALAELCAVVTGTAARRPRVFILETCGGMWKRPPWLRRRYERTVAQALSEQYHIVSVLISPSLHCAAHQDRERVFYLGVLRCLHVTEPGTTPLAAEQR